MSVNMKVLVTRSARLADPAPRRAALAQQRVDPLQVERRAEPLEGRSGGQEVTAGHRRVALGGQRLGVAQARPGALVGQVRRLPETPRLPEDW